jgi:hypothetical protein
VAGPVSGVMNLNVLDKLRNCNSPEGLCSMDTVYFNSKHDRIRKTKRGYI